MDKATADSLSIQFFAIRLTTLDTGILSVAVFKLELEMDYPSETGLCTVTQFPTDIPSPILEVAAVHRLPETANPSSNCPSKLTDTNNRSLV